MTTLFLNGLTSHFEETVSIDFKRNPITFCLKETYSKFKNTNVLKVKQYLREIRKYFELNENENIAY